MASEVIWAHNQWGESENWHKELKACLEMGADAVGEFAANAMYFAIGVLAYNLAQRLKRQVLPESYRTAAAATRRQRPVSSSETAKPSLSFKVSWEWK